MPRVKVFLRVKQDGKYPNYPASIAGNGRIEPLVAIVNDVASRFSLASITFDSPNKARSREAIQKDAPSKEMNIRSVLAPISRARCWHVVSSK